jgi:hypothetical protein
MMVREMKRGWVQVGLFVVLALAASAQSRMTVDQLVTFVRSSVQLQHDDRQIADYIKKNVKLANRLTPGAV